jgi:hypothetical protein
LRFHITDEAIKRLKEYLSATYSKFLTDKRVEIKVNGEPIHPITFEKWSYPPQYEPRRYTGTIPSPDGDIVYVDVIAGLTNESSPAGGEYGVYLYCNDRLIARGLKTYEVGFVRGLAGQPHPSISLTRVILSLKGPARQMPWNSSKSGLNPNHPIFISLRDWLVQVVKDYASLSRRLEGAWPERVFKYKQEKIVSVTNVDFPNAKKSFLPPLPKSRLRYGDLCNIANRAIAAKKPWTTGLYESIIAVDLISKQQLKQKNRISLIVLDSTLEIGFKEFLVNDSGHYYKDSELLSLFASRNKVHDEIEKYVALGELRKKIEFYYGLRCKLVHERVSAGVSDDQVEDYRGVVEEILKRLFGLRFQL